MTRIQRAYSFFLAMILISMVAFLPEPFFLHGNLYRQFPVFSLLEEKHMSREKMADLETLRMISESNMEYARELADKQKVEKEDSLSEEGEVSEEEQTDKKEVDSKSEKTDQKEVNSKSEEIDQKEISPKSEKTDQKAKESDLKTEKSVKNQMEADVENNEREALVKETAASVSIEARPEIDLSIGQLSEYNYLLNQFFLVDENTSAEAADLNADKFLNTDLSIQKDTDVPQILIYHSHSQETFADSREGVEEDTIVGVGEYLKKLLEETYGYQVLHLKEQYDLMSGTLDRSKAYDYARESVQRVLEENPSIEVVIDLHRDGVPEDRHLVTEINGKETARLLFYNGLSYTKNQGKISYLPNPYLKENLAFSFQLEYGSALYYPELYRGIYLAGFRYNLHLKPRALLLEAGAQTNTVQEVKNSMEPFAFLLDLVLTGNLVCPE